MNKKNYLLNGKRGNETHTGLNLFLKIVLNVFCMHKTDFFLTLFPSLSNSIKL